MSEQNGTEGGEGGWQGRAEGGELALADACKLRICLTGLGP